MRTDLSLYLHIPFCIRKCRYCDFLSFPASSELQAAYTKALIREIEAASAIYGGRPVTSVFVGGGTPTVLAAEHLARITETLSRTFRITEGAECSIEVNPGTLTAEHLEILPSFFDRASVGIQSAVDEELRFLGRIHDRKQARECVLLLHEAGIRDLNADLMSGLPGQTRERFSESLSFVTELPLSHVSVYSLIVEEGTAIAALLDKGKWQLPDEEEERARYEETEEHLSRFGFRRYEISNYAKEGSECAHNLRYWQGGDYLGFGLGAASLIDGERRKNTEDIRTYLGSCDDPDRLRSERTVLTENDRMGEFFFLGLRVLSGVDLCRFREIFGIGAEEIYGSQIADLTDKGLLLRDGEMLRLTKRGCDLANRVFSEFLLE